MPRKTTLGTCSKCGEWRSAVGVYRAFYSVQHRVSRPDRSTPATNKRTAQATGSFPARGYCIDCFMSLAKKQGLSAVRLRQIRQKLEGR
jgi:hypothetical protein